VRRTINDWYKRFPLPHKRELRRRFQSKDNYQHYGALFELYCHELLTCHGYDVQVHTNDSKTKNTRPDFLVSRESTPCFYLEATVVTKGEKFQKAALRRAVAFDAINSLDLPYCYLSVDVDSHGGKTLPPRIICAFLAREFRTWRDEGSNPDNRTYFEWDDWRINFRFLHSSGKKPDSRTIGLEVGEAGYDGSSQGLTRGLINKSAKLYDCNNLPYVVAVNAVNEFGATSDDIVESLFGMNSRVDRIPTENEQQVLVEGAAWFDERGYRDKGQSAVMFVQSLVDWTIFSANPIVCLHPFAVTRLAADSLQLWHLSAEMSEGQLTYPLRPGIDASTLLKIPPSLDGARQQYKSH
jgi:hypothetical protein